MVIPKLTDDYLPPGIYDCDIEEVNATFGTNDRRRHLLSNLIDYINDAKNQGISGEVIINGSFVTSKEDPEDIDIILVLDNYNITGPLNMEECRLLSCEYTSIEYTLDVLVAFKNDNTEIYDIEFFSRVREDPNINKGLLRVKI